MTEHLAGLPKQFAQYERLFAADGLPKSERQNLPLLDEILAYLQGVRSQTLEYLNNHDLENIRLWHWLIQHESQHAETMAMVLAMHQTNRGAFVYPMVQPVSFSESNSMVHIEAGSATVGSDAPEAIDNERPAHLVSTESYWIDRAPVTYGQYQRFIEAGGYQDAKWWSKAGWQWLKSANVDKPRYELSRGLGQTGPDNAEPGYPVCGVSWYEADAYARFVGKRLPTEAEWEKAVTLKKALEDRPDHNLDSVVQVGSVWEWTDTWFSAYSGFQPFPYKGYSQIYFDGEHRVLKGGSWATPKWVRRPSFRNWYHPHRRAVFAGFRCAISSSETDRN